MYGRGNNNVGNSGERTGISAEPPVDSVPRARSDIVDYRLRNNNSAGVGSSDYNSDNQGLSQQAYYHPDQQYQQVNQKLYNEIVYKLEKNGIYKSSFVLSVDKHSNFRCLRFCFFF